MKCIFKILTKKKEGQSHRETEVTIDWTGISREDLMVLAKNAIVADLQAKIQRGMFDTFPVKTTIIAKDVVQHDSVALWQYQPRETRPSSPTGSKSTLDALEKALAKLSPEERKVLLEIA